jgi:hypothetical protein
VKQHIRVCLFLVLFGLLTLCCGGLTDFERDIGAGYVLYKNNSFDVGIAKSDGDILISPLQYTGVGPLIDYAQAKDRLFTRHYGSKLRNRFAGDTFVETDSSVTWYFCIEKATDRVTGPLTLDELLKFTGQEEPKWRPATRW